MKNRFKIIVAIIFALTFSPIVFAEKMEKLILSGPFAGVSNPLIHMVETGALNDIAYKVEFKPWSGPDQLRLMTLGKDEFKADFAAMPSNVAANLYNRGVELKLMNISIWGILWIVSRDDNLTTIADLKGKKIAMPFRADMPDIVFEEIIRAEGFDSRKDFDLHYIPNPIDAIQLLLSGKIDHALLPEPALSMVLLKSKKKPNAPELFRSINIQEEWGRVFNREAKIPQAGIVALQSVLHKPEVLKRFQEEYKKSAKWILENPQETGVMVAKHLERLTPKAVEKSLKYAIIDVKSAEEAREELEFFFQKLLDSTPALVGGKLPDDNFYFYR